MVQYNMTAYTQLCSIARVSLLLLQPLSTVIPRNRTSTPHALALATNDERLSAIERNQIQPGTKSLSRGDMRSPMAEAPPSQESDMEIDA
jgi:hypothetical protein